MEISSKQLSFIKNPAFSGRVFCGYLKNSGVKAQRKTQFVYVIYH